MANIVNDKSPTTAQHSEFWQQVDKGLINKANFQEFLEKKKSKVIKKVSHQFGDDYLIEKEPSRYLLIMTMALKSTLLQTKLVNSKQRIIIIRH